MLRTDGERLRQGKIWFIVSVRLIEWLWFEVIEKANTWGQFPFCRLVRPTSGSSHKKSQQYTFTWWHNPSQLLFLYLTATTSLQGLDLRRMSGKSTMQHLCMLDKSRVTDTTTRKPIHLRVKSKHSLQHFVRFTLAFLSVSSSFGRTPFRSTHPTPNSAHPLNEMCLVRHVLLYVTFPFVPTWHPKLQNSRVSFLPLRKLQNPKPSRQRASNTLSN